MGAGIAQPQARDPVPALVTALAEVTQRGLAGGGIVAESFEASSRRLAWKPMARRAGRLVSRLPMPKSRVSLIGFPF